MSKLCECYLNLTVSNDKLTHFSNFEHIPQKILSTSASSTSQFYNYPKYPKFCRCNVTRLFGDIMALSCDLSNRYSREARLGKKRVRHVRLYSLDPMHACDSLKTVMQKGLRIRTQRTIFH